MLLIAKQSLQLQLHHSLCATYPNIVFIDSYTLYTYNRLLCHDEDANAMEKKLCVKYINDKGRKQAKVSRSPQLFVGCQEIKLIS